MLGMSIGILSRGSWQLRKQARKHLVAQPGEELTADTLLFGMVTRDRLTARGDGRAAGGRRRGGRGGGRGRVPGGSDPARRRGVRGRVLRDGDATRVTVRRPCSLAALGVALVAGVLGSVLAAPAPAPAGSRHGPRSTRGTWSAPTVRHGMLVARDRRSCVAGIAWIEGTGRADLFFSVGIAAGALLTLPATAAGLAHRPLRSGRPRPRRRPDDRPDRHGCHASTPTARASSRPWSPPTERLDRTPARTR